MVVKNFGTTAARDVRLVTDRPVLLRWHSDPEPLQLFDRLPVLVPGQEWRTVWDIQGHRLEDNEEPYSATVTAKDSRRRALPPEVFELDTRHFAFEMRRDENGLHQIGDALKNIERTTSRWSNGSSGLAVYARDGDAKDRNDRDRWRERRGARSAETSQEVGAPKAD